MNKTNEVENNLQESGISDDMIEIKDEPLDEPIEQDPLQMGHTVTNSMGHPVTNSMGYPVIDTMGHPTNMPIKQDPLQIETDTMRHPANMQMIKLQMERPVTQKIRHHVTETMGHPVTETMRHPVTETMEHPVTETVENPVTNALAHGTKLPMNETVSLTENMNTTSIPYHNFDKSYLRKENKRAYPFYVVCNPKESKNPKSKIQKKIATRNYSLSDAPVIPAHEEDKLYKCYECDEGFLDIETFNIHYESVHERGKP